MPEQVYRCPKHGEFEITFDWHNLVLERYPCPECSDDSLWVPSIPGTHVKGGTTPPRPPR